MDRGRFRSEDSRFESKADKTADALRDMWLREVEDVDGAPSFDEWRRSYLERASTWPAPPDSSPTILTEIPF